nr:RNA-directed DNA polymerase, eukaryota, reverse transcriptase zinc-binding domain protein [Tanacetum cinerariifolium]
MELEIYYQSRSSVGQTYQSYSWFRNGIRWERLCYIRYLVFYHSARNWSWQWRRRIDSGRTETLFHTLQSELVDVTLSSSLDSWKWLLGNDGSFSVASIRSHIDHLMLPSLASSTTWNSCLPRKVNTFVWRFCLDRLPHRLNLSKHGIDIESILCPICNSNVESLDHMFFSCEVASQLWRMVRIWCNIMDLSTPSYSEWPSWIDNVSCSSFKKKRLFVIIVSMFWVIWKF